MPSIRIQGLNGSAQAILFDLDGTLLDTAPDFVRIVRQMCLDKNTTPPDTMELRSFVSEGANAMLRCAFPEVKLDTALLTQYRELFLSHYLNQIAVETRLFEGYDVFLTTLERHNVPWGIVTNKPRYLSEALLAALKLDARCSVLVCPDDVQNTKPDPEPMLLASKLLGVATKEIVYVGDHVRDIQAGKAAGMQTIAAAYGYITPEENIRDWGADLMISNINDLQYSCVST